jgi:prolyl oligopeptidase
MPVDARPTIAAPDDDPYLWLEEIDGARALVWVEAQNAATLERFGTAGFAQERDALAAIYDRPDNIPFVARRGRRLYNFWKDAKNPRGLWRRTTLEEYRKERPSWETVIDLDALGAAENENWVWHGADCLKPDYRRCIVQLSRGGADADVVREFDLETKSFVKDGFFLPESKNSVGWLEGDTLYVGTDFGPGSMTTSGYPRIAKIWKRGTPLDTAETLFEGKADDMGVAAFRDHTKGFERDFVYRAITFYTSELSSAGRKLVKIEKPDSANASVHQNLLLVELRDDWTINSRTHPAGALLAADLKNFLKNERRFDVLFEPTKRKSLAESSPTLGHVLVNELDNVKNRVYVLSRENGRWMRELLFGMPQLGTVSASALDRTSRTSTS